jgi:hypothetical protein
MELQLHHNHETILLFYYAVALCTTQNALLMISIVTWFDMKPGLSTYKKNRGPVWATSAYNPGKYEISSIGFWQKKGSSSSEKIHKQAAALFFVFACLALFAYTPLVLHSKTSNSTRKAPSMYIRDLCRPLPLFLLKNLNGVGLTSFVILAYLSIKRITGGTRWIRQPAPCGILGTS